MRDIVAELAAVRRSTGTGKLPAGDARTVVLRRRYQAPVADVWDAITTAERINRWFLPVTGDLRVGGRYQLQGNAGGEVRQCEPPTLLVVTWVYGEQPTEADISEVQVRLTADGEEATQLELTHTAIVDDGRWQEFGPGAVGVGWDGALFGLGLHLSGASLDGMDPLEWAMSDEGRAFNSGSCDAWGEALREAGASEEQVARAVAGTRSFYLPPEA